MICDKGEWPESNAIIIQIKNSVCTINCIKQFPEVKCGHIPPSSLRSQKSPFVQGLYHQQSVGRDVCMRTYRRMCEGGGGGGGTHKKVKYTS